MTLQEKLADAREKATVLKQNIEMVDAQIRQMNDRRTAIVTEALRAEGRLQLLEEMAAEVSEPEPDAS